MISADKYMLSVMALIGALYVGACQKIDVGYFNDDARYILSASSLSQGHYRDLEVPGHPLNIDRLPGYPLFLSPFIRPVRPHWSRLKALSIILTLFACFLLNSLFADSLTEWPRFFLIVFFGLNPTIIKYSCSVLSEPFFLFLVLSTYVLYKIWLKQKATGIFWLMSVPLTWAVMTRPEGLALLAALSASLALNHRKKASVQVLLFPSMALGALLLGNYLSGSSPSGYLQQMAQIAAYLAGRFLPVAVNMAQVLKVAFVDSLLQASFPLPNNALNDVVVCGTGALGVALAAAGFFSLLKRAPKHERALHLSMGLFVLVYLLMHMAFLSVNSRYFFALIPFFMAWLMSGTSSFLRGWDRRHAAVSVGGIGLLILYLNPWSSPADKLWKQAHSYAIPRQTFDWIKESTDPQAFILAIKASAVHLYTDRYAVSEIQAGSWPQFCGSLLDDGITHVLLAPNRLMVLSGQKFQNMLSVWNSADLWTRQWPDVFVKVYENPREGTTLYRIVPAALRKRLGQG